MKCIILVLFIFIGFGAAKADQAPNYIDDPRNEIPHPVKELPTVEDPRNDDPDALYKRLFNAELSNEFTDRYREKFGRTETEESFFLVNRNGYAITPWGISRTQEDEERRAFAEYMVKRLVEYHTEDIMKREPSLRRVYEIKQRISNVEIKVTDTSRVETMYSFVGNYLDLKYYNSVANVITRVTMDPKQLTPSTPSEIETRVIRQLAYTVEGELGYRIYDQNLRAQLTKMLTPIVSIYVAQTVALKGGQFDQSRESLSIIGMKASF